MDLYGAKKGILKLIMAEPHTPKHPGSARLARAALPKPERLCPEDMKVWDTCSQAPQRELRAEPLLAFASH